MRVFIPPAMSAAPAILARLMQLGTRMIRLPAISTMMLYRLMKTMIGLGDTPLAIVIIGAQAGRTGKKQESRQRRTRQHDFPQPKYFGLKICLHPFLLYFEVRLKHRVSSTIPPSYTPDIQLLPCLVGEIRVAEASGSAGLP
jgi:hypothetical protein